MFLTKKTAGFMNKAKGGEGGKPKRVLGGWDDEEEESKGSPQPQPKNIETKNGHAKAGVNLLQEEGMVDLTLKKASSSEKTQNHVTNNTPIQNWDELNDRDDIDCEKKLIEGIVSQSGGIRVKPTEGMLSELLKQIRGMEVGVIGSLLLSKIEVNYPYMVKIKALYTIEFLVKRNAEYAGFFRLQAGKLKEYPEPEENVENYRKLLRGVLNYLGVVQEGREERKMFVDPQYNDQPAKTNMAAFLHDNANKIKKEEPKRGIIGPGQAKTHQKQPVPAQAKKGSGQLNLLQMDEPKNLSRQLQGLNLLL